MPRPLWLVCLEFSVHRFQVMSGRSAEEPPLTAIERYVCVCIYIAKSIDLYAMSAVCMPFSIYFLLIQDVCAI